MKGQYELARSGDTLDRNGGWTLSLLKANKGKYGWKNRFSLVVGSLGLAWKFDFIFEFQGSMESYCPRRKMIVSVHGLKGGTDDSK